MNLNPFSWFKQRPPAQPVDPKIAALQIRRLELEVEKQRRINSLMESWGDLYLPDYYQSEMMIQPERQYLGIGMPNAGSLRDRAQGANYPFVRTVQDLNNLRYASRNCVATNPYAEGTVNGLTSYVISTGFGATCKSDTNPELASKCQEILSHWMDKNNFDGLQEELYRRTEIDGEAIYRLFPQRNGDLAIRAVEPECVVPPMEESPNGPWSFGIKTDPEDSQDIQYYNIRSMHTDGTITEESVKAKWIVHYKLNATAAMKRGLPSFSFATLESFNQALKLKTALGYGAAVQAAIAGIREHEGATEAQIGDFADDQLTNLPGMPFIYPSTTPASYEGTGVVQPGTIMDLKKGTKWVDPPGASAVEEHIQVLQAVLRAAGSRWSAPEWLVSGRSDSMSYASSLTAESPFLRACARRQRDLKRIFRDILEKVLHHANLHDEIPDDWDKVVSIDISAPAMEVRDIGALARANEIYHKMRVVSLRTIAASIGVNYSKERAYLQQEAQDALQPTDPIHNTNPATQTAWSNQPGQGVDNNPSARVVDSEVAGVEPGAQTQDADAKAQTPNPPTPTKNSEKSEK